VLVSSEFGEPNAYEKGFDLADVEAGRYGHRLHFWNLAERTLEQTVDLGENGLLPFEVRWQHDPGRRKASSGPRSRARCGASTATAAGRRTR
jgi:selenium-binding protein 1